MIKKSLFLSILFLVCTAQAVMMFDRRTSNFFTFPENKDVGALEYNMYCKEFVLDISSYLKMANCTHDYALQMARINAVKRAGEVDSPAAKQFIADVVHVSSIYHIAHIMGVPVD